MTGRACSPIRVVLADANVLYSRVLRDYLLYAATQGALEIRWSAAILSEVVEHLSRNLATFDSKAGARLIEAMNDAFPSAQVDPDEAAIGASLDVNLPDEGDRHVLAAAVAVGADVLCTDNLRDFPSEVVGMFGIRCMSADASVSRLVTEFPAEMTVAHRLAVAKLHGASDESTLAALRRAGAVNAAALMERMLRA